MNNHAPFNNSNVRPLWAVTPASSNFPLADEVYEEMMGFASATGQPQAQAVVITPEFANYLLTINENNRSVSKAYVKRFATDMRSGNWHLNGEAIVISKCGHLNTGQHRALACVEANVPFATMLIVGVDRASRLTDGQGKVKLAPDRIAMRGNSTGSEARALSAVATGLLGLECGVVNVNPRVQNICVRGTEPTQIEIDNYVAERQDTLLRMLNIVPNKGRVISRTRLATVLTWLRDHGAREDQLHLFAHALVTGASLAQDNPIYQTRRFFEEKTGTRQVIPGAAFEVLLRCWNQWVTGQSVSRRPVIKGEIPAPVIPR